MKGFESAYALLEGFEFVASKDRENALMLRKWLGDIAVNPGTGPFPLVMITGPMGCGKTTLIRRLIDEAKPRATTWPKIEKANLDYATSNQASLVVFEDLQGQRIDESAVEILKSYVAAREWTFRPLHSRDEVTRGKCSVVVVTGQPFSVKPFRNREGQEDWAIEIRLKARAEQEGGQ